MATYSSILAWRIPWTEEPSRPWSIGRQRVGRLKWLSTHSHTFTLDKTIRGQRETRFHSRATYQIDWGFEDREISVGTSVQEVKFGAENWSRVSFWKRLRRRKGIWTKWMNTQVCILVLVLVCLGGGGGIAEYTEWREEMMIRDRDKESGREEVWYSRVGWPAFRFLDGNKPPGGPYWGSVSSSTGQGFE